MIDRLFSCISKEERFESIIHDLEVFNVEKEKEQAAASSSLPKRRLGRPRKEEHIHLLKRKVEKVMKGRKTRGTYTNWFCPSLWHPIQICYEKISQLPWSCALFMIRLQTIRGE
jgi:hypothetical protein